MGTPDAPRLSLYELWLAAGRDRAQYRELMASLGYLLSPGDDGYEAASPQLQCGWQGVPHERGRR